MSTSKLTKLCLLSFVLLFATSAYRAQERFETTVDALLEKVDAETSNYIRTFRNLSAIQTKSIRTYDRSGQPARIQTIVSDMVVVDGLNDYNVQEFFNVRVVDGKPLPNVEKRATDFFRKLSRNRNQQSVIDDLRKESLRHDIGINIYGYSLSQTVVLSREVRPSFAYEIEAVKTAEDSGLLLIRYEQLKSHPNLNVQLNAPKSLGIDHGLFRGELLVDGSTFQILKATNEVFFVSPKFSEPFVVVRSISEYTSSPFGIVLPNRIVWETFNPEDVANRKKTDTKPFVPRSRPVARLVMEYSNFKEFSVEVIEGSGLPSN